MKFKNKKLKSMGSAVFSNNTQMAHRVFREFKNAISSYRESFKLSGFLRRRVLYDTPWFIIAGLPGSGKTTMLTSCNSSFPFRYPQDKDVETISGINWFFGREIVGIDLPGKFFGSECGELFESFYRCQAKVRPGRPADGIICIIDIESVTSYSVESVKKSASNIRRKLNELIRYWGIELPVFCVFSKMDVIPGFTEIFYDTSVKWSDQLLGAFFSKEQKNDTTCEEFNKEFDLLCSSLKTTLYKRLARENDNSNRRIICRFLIEFEGIKVKTGEFLSELFKSIIDEEKPVLKGFYFTSCKPVDKIGQESSKLKVQSSVIPRTVIYHPLNPHRNEINNQFSEQKTAGKIRSLFTQNFFDEVVPNGTQMLLKTRSTTHKEVLNYWLLSWLFALFSIFLTVYLFYSFKNASDLYDVIRVNVSYTLQKEAGPIEAYSQLQNLSEMVARFREFSKRGVPLFYGLGFVKTQKIYEMLKKIYFQQVYRLIAVPLAEYLELCIKNIYSEKHDLTFDDHAKLYRLLKTYLSISEAVALHPERIDTTLIRKTLDQDLYPLICQVKKINRLPANLETVLKRNIDLYLYFIKTGEMPLIPQNQYIVKQTRDRLGHIPDSRQIYESIVNRLLTRVPSLTIESITGEKNKCLISSNRKINMIYTQDGWDQYVKNEILVSIKNPVKIDWVSGGNSTESVVIDEDKMRSDLIDMYVDDLCREWLIFLQSINYEKTTGKDRTAQYLAMLSSENRGISVLLESVLKSAKVKILPEENVSLTVLKNLTERKIPHGKQIASATENRNVNNNYSERIDQYFGPLTDLLDSQGRYGGIPAYKEKLASISDALVSCARGNDFSTVFNGTDKDPMFNAWKTAEKLILSLPEYLQLPMSYVLMKPLEKSAETVMKLISDEIDELWKRTVLKIYNEQISGKYPFYKSRSDASLDAALEFLRPVTGNLYGFISNHLSSYLVKDDNQWRSAAVGCIKMSFNKEFFELLDKADELSSILFNHDGSLRAQTVHFMPLPGNKVTGSLLIDKQEYKIIADYFHTWLKWPDPGRGHEVTLRIFINRNYFDELSFYGEWALLRLLGAANINVQNNTTLIARWERNIQNMVMLPYGIKVQSSGSVQPFAESVFSGLECPEKIME